VSRDGRRLAYSVFRNPANVWALPIPARGVAVASAARRLTSGSQTVEGLAVSPDGRWLAFDSDRNGNQDVYKMPLAGGEPVQLTSAPSDDFMPRWSPSGRELAYFSMGAVPSRRVQVVAANGGPPHSVTAGASDPRFPSWSPDGRSLVFHADSQGRPWLHLVSRRGDDGWGAPRPLTAGASGQWAPDGRAILYLQRGALWTTDAAARAAPRLVLRADAGDSSWIGDARWSRDGRTIYYKQFDAAGRASIRSVPAAGGAPRLLARFDDPAHQSPRPEFDTDGRRLYYTVSERASDVWTMELGRGRP
jgi:Tol biopolymer transport system component